MEKVMLHAILRMLARFNQSADQPRSTLDPQSGQDTFDPNWHGDHWQNLLASPMDARHYVMEDWTFAAAPVFADDPSH
jgi:hypothetical protein